MFLFTVSFLGARSCHDKGTWSAGTSMEVVKRTREVELLFEEVLNLLKKERVDLVAG